ncbi:hypothetical protein DCC79_08310 [bacterium]|nr:MAG: hypothetical protein DCC79_08310 [bacterium]
MTLEQSRLDLATRATAQAFRGQPDAPLAARLDAFQTVYAAVAGLEGGDAAWSDAALEAAWDLVAPAFPHGGTADAIAHALESAHAAVVATAARPAPARRPRPRRDA